MGIVAVVGSPRLQGNTNFLVDTALAEAVRHGAETEKIVLSQHNIAPCLGHKSCATFKECLQKDDASGIIEKFAQADGVILATPVYWYNMTAQMKTFIDRHYFQYRHNAKYRARVVGLIVVAEIEAIEDTLHTLRQFVDWWFPIGEENILVLQGYALNPGDAEKNAGLVEAAQQMGRKMGKKLATR